MLSIVSVKLILNIFLLVSICICVYFTTLYMREKEVTQRIKVGLHNYIEEEQRQQIELLKRQFYVQVSKKNRYIEYLRLLINKSTINTKFKIVTPFVIILLNAASSLIFYLISAKTISIIYSNIIFLIFGFLVPQIFLKMIIILKGSKVDKMLIDFMNILINFLSVKNDIVYAIENSVKYASDPIKTFLEKFVFEVQHGVPPYTALVNLGKSVENEQFKFLCKALSLCNKTSGKYLQITSKAKDLYIKTYEKDLERKNEALKSSFGLIGMVIIAAITLYLLKIINPNLFIQLKESHFGQFLVSYVVLSLLIVILIALNSLKFDY